SHRVASDTSRYTASSSSSSSPHPPSCSRPATPACPTSTYSPSLSPMSSPHYSAGPVLWSHSQAPVAPSFPMQPNYRNSSPSTPPHPNAVPSSPPTFSRYPPNSPQSTMRLSPQPSSSQATLHRHTQGSSSRKLKEAPKNLPYTQRLHEALRELQFNNYSWEVNEHVDGHGKVWHQATFNLFGRPFAFSDWRDNKAASKQEAARLALPILRDTYMR
ncbi:hypothetical protein M408DRAFT_100897, partial [Serendipita vermifera MAFF 305830]